MNIKLTEVGTDNPRVFEVGWVKFIGSHHKSGGFIWSTCIRGNPDVGLYQLQSNDGVLNTEIKITSIASDNQFEFVCV